MKPIKIIVEKYPDTYVAYPVGMKGVVVSQGDTFEETIESIKSAIKFHIETFGVESFELDFPVLEAFVAETMVAA
jgi:predicted RNase H-like HicB family nuclease